MKILKTLTSLLCAFTLTLTSTPLVKTSAADAEKTVVSKESFTLDYKMEFIVRTDQSQGENENKIVTNDRKMNCIVTTYIDNSLELQCQSLDDNYRTNRYAIAECIDLGNIKFPIGDYTIKLKYSGGSSFIEESSMLESYTNNNESYDICFDNANFPYGEGFIIELSPNRHFDESCVEIFNHTYTIGKNIKADNNVPIYKTSFYSQYKLSSKYEASNSAVDTSEKYYIICVVYIYKDNTIEVVGQNIEKGISGAFDYVTYEDSGTISFPTGYYTIEDLTGHSRNNISYSKRIYHQWIDTYNNNMEGHSFQFELLGTLPRGDVFHFVLKPTGQFKDKTTVSILGHKIDLLDIQESTSYIEGDINNDNTITVADLVLLQKWLLAVPNTELPNWRAADLCKDNKLDVFDLCLLRRKVVEHNAQ